MLPARPLDPTAFNQVRGQYIAERLIESVRRAYPRLANDSNAVIIAVTEADMYIQSFDWRYAFNFRMFGQFAVVSAARMFPPPPRADAAAVFQSRARKMVSKNIAMLVYGHQVNDDPTSLLYANAMDPEALDVMREDFGFLKASPAPEAPPARPRRRKTRRSRAHMPACWQSASSARPAHRRQRQSRTAFRDSTLIASWISSRSTCAPASS